MNSFKKVSLIIAAALTSTMLVSPAANAAVSTTLTVGGSAASTTGASASTAIAIPVPADNSVDAADAVKFAITGLETGTAVTAVATNATIVPAVTGTTVVTASSGSSSLTVNTGTGTTADFYVYTKTTVVGSVAVTIAGNTTTYYVQGTAGALNSIALSAPTSGAAGTVATLKVTGYDVFGNAKGGATINTLVSANGAATATALTTDTATATLGTKEQTVTLPASGSVVVTAYATVATAVTGLSAPIGAVNASIVVRDLAGELAAKNAEVATLTAQLALANQAKSTAVAALEAEKIASATAKAASDLALAAANAAYKTKYNALATKWNKKNPKAKVALIK
jgi:hypothetical protein